MCSDFRDQAKRAKAKANVLSLFSGIGSGILALKRLNISIGNLVVVEHDSVAEAVCSSHHNNESVASYHWMKTFEELEGSIDAIMATYGRKILAYCTLSLDTHISLHCSPLMIIHRSFSHH